MLIEGDEVLESSDRRVASPLVAAPGAVYGPQSSLKADKALCDKREHVSTEGKVRRFTGVAKHT